MNWTVIWIPNAETELAELWLSATDRAELSRVVEQIDEKLSVDPLNLGESRERDERIAFSESVAVEFVVDQPKRRVYVYHVRQMKRR